MKYWGHSDANNARRLNLLNGGGKTPDLGAQLAVFHLNHNPSVKVAHETIMVHNDWKTWVEDVNSPLSRNPKNWGLADTDLPLIRIDKDLDAKEILKTHRRPRLLLSSLKSKIQIRLWRLISRGAQKIDKGG